MENYGDTDGRKDRHQIAMFIKEDIPHIPATLSMTGRTALVAHLPGPGVNFLAGHLDDRHESTRQRQSEVAIEWLGPHAVAALDANAMRRRDPRAFAFRVAGPLIRHLPAVDPQPGVKQPKLERIGSLLQRSAGMADGGTVALWEQNGYRDPVGFAPTLMKGGRRVLSLDRILVRGMPPGDVQILQPKGLSDHCAVVA